MQTTPVALVGWVFLVYLLIVPDAARHTETIRHVDTHSDMCVETLQGLLQRSFMLEGERRGIRRCGGEGAHCVQFSKKGHSRWKRHGMGFCVVISPLLKSYD